MKPPTSSKVGGAVRDTSSIGEAATVRNLFTRTDPSDFAKSPKFLAWLDRRRRYGLRS